MGQLPEGSGGSNDTAKNSSFPGQQEGSLAFGGCRFADNDAFEL